MNLTSEHTPYYLVYVTVARETISNLVIDILIHPRFMKLLVSSGATDIENKVN